MPGLLLALALLSIVGTYALFRPPDRPPGPSKEPPFEHEGFGLIISDGVTDMPLDELDAKLKEHGMPEHAREQVLQSERDRRAGRGPEAKAAPPDELEFSAKQIGSWSTVWCPRDWGCWVKWEGRLRMEIRFATKNDNRTPWMFMGTCAVGMRCIAVISVGGHPEGWGWAQPNDSSPSQWPWNMSHMCTQNV